MNTEIITVRHIDSEAEEVLRRAAEKIKEGGLVVFPTETVYGLGADATSATAAKKIFEAKGRPSDNPLIIHVASPADAEKYTHTNELYYKLAQSFMPGPITVVLKSKEIIPKETRAGLGTVAVRCPSHPVARRVIELSGTPVAAPSANLSGSPSPTKAAHVIDDMYGRVDFIIDGGDCDFGLESTIVKINDDESLTLLRPGKITVADLQTVTDKVHIADAVVDKLKDGQVAISPGMKYRHYAPKAPLYLLSGSTADIIRYLKTRRSYNKKIAVIEYSENISAISDEIPDLAIYEFGKESDERAHAHSLFNILRDIDKKDFDEIYAPLPKKEGLGLALYNRMIRAAAHQIIEL